jgi:oleate hydratase
MAACTGREIITELRGHLRLDEQAEALLASLTCIPCMMPYITSRFLARRNSDRQQVIPRGTAMQDGGRDGRGADRHAPATGTRP